MDKKGAQFMPTTLGKPFSISWRGRVPHMLKPDIPVWYRFLILYGEPFRKLYYDCLLGGETYTPEQLKDPMQRMAQSLSGKRADAIAELDDELWIIEVSSDPGLRSLGQLQTYRVLWLRDPIIRKPERLVLVCETIEKDLLDAASTYGLTIYVV